MTRFRGRYHLHPSAVIQELLGHKSVRSTMIYTHVLNGPGLGVRSPLDTLEDGRGREAAESRKGHHS